MYVRVFLMEPGGTVSKKVIVLVEEMLFSSRAYSPEELLLKPEGQQWLS